MNLLTCFGKVQGEQTHRVRKSEEFNFTSGLGPRSSAVLFGFWLFKYNAIMQVSCLACSFRLFQSTFVLMAGSNENKSLWLRHKRLQSERKALPRDDLRATLTLSRNVHTGSELSLSSPAAANPAKQRCVL